MGYLLKEGLKTLCGVNQWSYAVYWKIGCHNPKLLIWEECYYEPASCSRLPRKENPDAAFNDFNASWISPEASNPQAGDQVHLLVNKMMMDNHVNIVGEGLVGRVAFTGNHQWILSESYCGDFHPPEVVKQVCQQFSAGMQTVAVIPVLPHGVVQFGSTMTIMENLGFINDVTSLVLQLGYVSGALLTQNYEAKEHAPRIGVPVGNFTPGAFSLESNVSNAPCSFDPFNYVHNTSQRSLPLAEQIQNELQSNGAARTSLPVMNGVAKAEVISSSSELWSNQNSSFYMPSSTLSLPSSSLPPSNCSTVRGADQNEMFRKVEQPNSNSVDCCFTSNSSFAYSSDSKLHNMENKFGQIELHGCKKEMGRHTIQAHGTPLPQVSEHLNMAEQMLGGQTPYDDVCFQPKSGDDLFDVLGADFKNKLFNNCWKSNESSPNIQIKKSPASSEYKSAGQGNSESGIFSSAGTDHLLEAVVSKTQPYSKQSVDDNVSCRTTVTNTSSSSMPNTSLPYGRFGVSDHLKGELFGVPKYLAKAEAMSSCSKEESRSYSQGSSIYGSQISSWMEKDQKATPSNSVSTGHSKKADESGKATRKRLKPGENPRPRPKDRQMIQDRVKELREIVPVKLVVFCSNFVAFRLTELISVQKQIAVYWKLIKHNFCLSLNPTSIILL